MAEDRPPTGPVLRFDYLKSTQFRVIHADGVVGGPTPKGALLLSFWNERAPIPQQVTYRVEPSPSGKGVKLGDEILDLRVARESIVREVEVGIYMDYDTAEALNDWLTKHLKKLREMGQGKSEDEE